MMISLSELEGVVCVVKKDTTKDSIIKEYKKETRMIYEQMELQATDIMQIMKIIEVMAARGAILPTEMSVVGHVYEKMQQCIEEAQSEKINPDKQSDA